jgi:glyoxylase-like metal-dependent hydrolase (beta-lactamase superfamily II)
MIMAKPRFYVLCWGPVTVFKNENETDAGLKTIQSVVAKFPQLKKAKRNGMYASSTVGLVEYDSDDGRKFMMVDTGLSADWGKIRSNMERVGCKVEDVTHILQSHWDEDHFENITRFPHVLCIWGGTGPHYRPVSGHVFVTGTNIYVSMDDLYPDGFIEDENIRYYYAYRAHSRDETYYVIDTENEGKIAFIGDLVHFPLSQHPTLADHLFLDRTFCINIFRKYSNLRDIYEKHPDLDKIYAGHASAPMTRKELGDYLEMLRGTEYRGLMKEYIDEWKRTLSSYEEVLRSDESTIKSVEMHAN